MFDDALSVYTFSMNRTPEDQWIAEFWSDDVRGLTFSPAGRWISITNQIVRKEEIEALIARAESFRFKLAVTVNAVIALQDTRNQLNGHESTVPSRCVCVCVLRQGVRK